MTTITEALPVSDEKTTTDKPEIFHYVRKTKILESAVEGTMVQAICGTWFVVTKTPPPNAGVCPDCRDLYEQMKS